MDHEKINEFIKQIQDFYDLSHTEKIVFFGYYLQYKENYDCFTPKDILNCYSHVSDTKPTNVFDRLSKLAESKKIVVKQVYWKTLGLSFIIQAN